MVLFGKSKAWQRWISDNLDALMLYAKWQTRNEADAQDVLQWVLEKVWADFEKKDPDGIYPLVCQKIRLRSIDFYRSKDSQAAREKKYGEFTLIDSSSHTGSELFHCFVEAEELQQLLLKELHNLESSLQEIVILHVWNELSFRDISTIVGLSKSSVAEKYQQALEQLKSKFNTLEVCNS